jgi:hypothetical protein
VWELRCIEGRYQNIDYTFNNHKSICISKPQTHTDTYTHKPTPHTLHVSSIAFAKNGFAYPMGV